MPGAPKARDLADLDVIAALIQQAIVTACDSDPNQHATLQTGLPSQLAPSTTRSQRATARRPPA